MSLSVTNPTRRHDYSVQSLHTVLYIERSRAADDALTSREQQPDVLTEVRPTFPQLECPKKTCANTIYRVTRVPVETTLQQYADYLNTVLGSSGSNPFALGRISTCFSCVLQSSDSSTQRDCPEKIPRPKRIVSLHNPILSCQQPSGRRRTRRWSRRAREERKNSLC